MFSELGRIWKWWRSVSKYWPPLSWTGWGQLQKPVRTVAVPVVIRTGYRPHIKQPLSMSEYRGADKFLARPGRKQATATEDFDFHISYL